MIKKERGENLLDDIAIELLKKHYRRVRIRTAIIVHVAQGILIFYVLCSSSNYTAQVFPVGTIHLSAPLHFPHHLPQGLSIQGAKALCGLAFLCSVFPPCPSHYPPSSNNLAQSIWWPSTQQFISSLPTNS